MFSLPGIVALLLLTYVRPQEIYPALAELPLLYVAFGLAIVGLIVDIKLRLVRPLRSPQLPWVVAFCLWCLASVAFHAPEELPAAAVEVGVIFAIFLLVAHGAQSFTGLRMLGGGVLLLSLFLALIAVHQRFAPYGCVELDPTSGREFRGTPDGRPCERRAQCYAGDPEPGAEYVCERVGLLGTTTVGNGRVRYRGTLQDPNELALVVSLALPLAVALLRRRGGSWRRVLLLVAIALIAATVLFTRSRGGLLVFVAVVGVYLLRRYRLRGALLAVALAIPLLLWVAAHRADSAASSTDRLEAWYEGMSMFRSSPVWGVGFGRFDRYHYLTAHNSYVLAAAELGLVGAFLWLSVLYTSTKQLLVALRRYAGRPEAVEARSWAAALLAALSGLAVGIFFLSFSYHFIFWVYVGLSGAFSAAVQGHDPAWRVRFGLHDWALAGAATVVIVLGMHLFTRINPP